MSEVKTRFTAWPIIVSGILLLMVGIVCLFFPGIALATVALVIGITFLISAVACFAGAILGGYGMPLTPLILNGVLDLLIGVVACAHPVATATVTVWILFALLLFYGCANLGIGWREYRSGFDTGAPRMIASIAAIVTAILVIAMPELLPVFLGIIAMIRGVMLIALGIRSPREVEL